LQIFGKYKYVYFLRENTLSGTILAIALMANMCPDLHRFH